MNTGYQTASLGNLFGLPYVVMRKPAPIDTTTLNYNWQIWETNAFSIYTKETDEVDEQSAQAGRCRRAAVSQPGRFTAEVEAEITCPTSGVVFFALKKPLTTEHEIAFKVIRRLHGGCL